MHEIPIPRDPSCPAGCGHTWHLLVCDVGGCLCDHPPIPGIYP